MKASTKKRATGPACSACKSPNIVTTTTKTAGAVTRKTVKCHDCKHAEELV